jgi:hypothetical protein
MIAFFKDLIYHFIFLPICCDTVFKPFQIRMLRLLGDISQYFDPLMDIEPARSVCRHDMSDSLGLARLNWLGWNTNGKCAVRNLLEIYRKI